MSTLSATGLGQLFILELEQGKWSHGLESQLRSVQPAGVIVPARHVRSDKTLADLLRNITGTLQALPFLGMADGALQPDPRRAAFLVLPAFPSPDDIARKGVKATEALGKLRGAILRGHGFNVDFALSLDLTPAGTRTALASFTFGSDPPVVAGCGLAYLRGLHRQGVLACGKHFPGLGSVQLDPRSETLLSAKPMASLWREDLVPFRELLPRLPLVMISYAAYKAYDFDPPRPAMLSSEMVVGLLRKKLGYQGIAVASLPELARAQGKIDPGNAAVKALEAGCDLIIIPGNKKSVESALQAISNSLESGRISPERVQESLGRIRGVMKNLPAPLRALSARALR